MNENLQLPILVPKVLSTMTTKINPISVEWSPSCKFFLGVRFQELIDYLAWAAKPIKQGVVYEDRKAVDEVLSKLRKLPPLVTPTEACRMLTLSKGTYS